MVGLSVKAYGFTELTRKYPEKTVLWAYLTHGTFQVLSADIIEEAVIVLRLDIFYLRSLLYLLRWRTGFLLLIEYRKY